MTKAATTGYWHPLDPRCPASGSYLTQRWCALCDQPNQSIAMKQMLHDKQLLSRSERLAQFVRSYDDMTPEQRLREEAVLLHLHDMLCQLDSLSHNRLRSRVRRMRRRIWQHRPELQMHEAGHMLGITLDIFNFVSGPGRFIQDSTTYRPKVAPEID